MVALQRLARGIGFMTLVVMAACGGDEDSGKANGEVCAADAECTSSYCETQLDGSKVCATKAASAGGW